MAKIIVQGKPRAVDVNDAPNELVYIVYKGDVDQVAGDLGISPQAVYKVLGAGCVATRSAAERWEALSDRKGCNIPAVEFIWPDAWHGPDRHPELTSSGKRGNGGKGARMRRQRGLYPAPAATPAARLSVVAPPRTRLVGTRCGTR